MAIKLNPIEPVQEEYWMYYEGKRRTSPFKIDLSNFASPKFKCKATTLAEAQQEAITTLRPLCRADSRVDINYSYIYITRKKNTNCYIPICRKHVRNHYFPWIMF